MFPSSRTELDAEQALKVWEEYQKEHDVTALIGQAVGIDPDSSEVFFGDSAKEIGLRLLAEGRHRPLFFLRVGSNSYQEKRAKR